MASRKNTPMWAILLRWVLGVVFLYTGWVKAMHPVDFLKVLHEYEFSQNPWLLSAIAALLPWIEVLCGFLLVTGLAVRGTALLVAAMLIPFTGMILQRGWALGEIKGIPFCSVRFDCGCGGGEINLCRKLSENGVLLAISLMVLLFYSFRRQKADLKVEGGK